MATRNGKPVENLRITKIRSGYCDAGKYHKPVWQLQYTRGKLACAIHVKCGGDTRPLGQDVIDAAQRGNILASLDELFDMRIVE